MKTPGAIVPWSPYRLPVSILRLHLAAEDHGTALMTDDGAGLISSWKDRRQAIAVTAATTARGQYSATGFAGTYPAVSGDGVAVSMTYAATTGLPTGSEPCVMAVVGGAFSGNVSVLSYGGAGTGISRVLRSNGGIARAAIAGVNLDASALWTPSIVVAIVEASRIRIRVNGVETSVASTLGTETTTVRLRIFSNTANTAASFASGPVAEAMVGSVMTDDQIKKLEAYWALKYPAAGIILPSDNLYKGTVL